MYSVSLQHSLSGRSEFRLPFRLLTTLLVFTFAFVMVAVYAPATKAITEQQLHQLLATQHEVEAAIVAAAGFYIGITGGGLAVGTAFTGAAATIVGKSKYHSHLAKQLSIAEAEIQARQGDVGVRHQHLSVLRDSLEPLESSISQKQAQAASNSSEMSTIGQLMQEQYLIMSYYLEYGDAEFCRQYFPGFVQAEALFVVYQQQYQALDAANGQLDTEIQSLEEQAAPIREQIQRIEDLVAQLNHQLLDLYFKATSLGDSMNQLDSEMSQISYIQSTSATGQEVFDRMSSEGLWVSEGQYSGSMSSSYSYWALLEYPSSS